MSEVDFCAAPHCFQPGTEDLEVSREGQWIPKSFCADHAEAKIALGARYREDKCQEQSEIEYNPSAQSALSPTQNQTSLPTAPVSAETVVALVAEIAPVAAVCAEEPATEAPADVMTTTMIEIRGKKTIATTVTGPKCKLCNKHATLRGLCKNCYNVASRRGTLDNIAEPPKTGTSFKKAKKRGKIVPAAPLSPLTMDQAMGIVAEICGDFGEDIPPGTESHDLLVRMRALLGRMQDRLDQLHSANTVLVNDYNAMKSKQADTAFIRNAALADLRQISEAAGISLDEPSWAVPTICARLKSGVALTEAEFLKRVEWWNQAIRLEVATTGDLPKTMVINGVSVEIPTCDIANAVMAQADELRRMALNGAE